MMERVSLNQQALNNDDLEDQRRESSKQFKEMVQIVTVISFYFVVSISLVFLNKILLQDFKYPLFVTWFQLLVALGLLIPLGLAGKYYAPLSYFRPFEFNWAIAKSVLPLTVVFVGMISFNNLCLQYVEVSFYQVARSLTICFSIVFTYYILNTRTSARALQCAGVVFLGFVLGSLGEINFSTIGVVFGVIASAFVALYGIYVKKIIAVVDNDEQRLIIYNTVLSMIILLPISILTGEFNTMMQDPNINSSQFWWTMTLAGVAGYLINVATYLQIKVTSPLTHSISGTAKACVQTVLGVMIYHNQISAMNGLGILLVIGGSFMYGYVRYLEMRK